MFSFNILSNIDTKSLSSSHSMCFGALGTWKSSVPCKKNRIYSLAEKNNHGEVTWYGVNFINGFTSLRPTFTPCAQLLRSFLLAQMLGAGRERWVQGAKQCMNSTPGGLICFVVCPRALRDTGSKLGGGKKTRTLIFNVWMVLQAGDKQSGQL